MDAGTADLLCSWSRIEIDRDFVAFEPMGLLAAIHYCMPVSNPQAPLQRNIFTKELFSLEGKMSNVLQFTFKSELVSIWPFRTRIRDKSAASIDRLIVIILCIIFTHRVVRCLGGAKHLIQCHESV